MRKPQPTNRSYFLTFASIHHVLEKVQLSHFIGVLHFQITHCSLKEWRPVHHVFSAVHQSLVMKSNKCFRDSVTQMRVHGKRFSTPVSRGSQRTKLPSDMATLLLLVFPDTSQELFTPNFLASCTFRNECFLHLKLCCNTSMIGTLNDDETWIRHNTGTVWLF